jgi:tetratricopeptide (TPR) repeat protein
MIKIPPELRNAICNDNLILFIGAGLSYNLTNIKKNELKGWSNLVEGILNHLISNGYDVSHLLPLVNKYDPIKILDLIESDKSINKKGIYYFIKDFFDLDTDNNFELHRLLFQLSKKIITTNYDNAFEIAVRQLRKNKAYKGKNYELTTHKDPNSVLLFKLHGCFEDVDSMVLFPTNYKDLYENPARDAEHSLLVLKNIILNKSILFIGTGMGDFQINNIFYQIKQLQGDYNQNHFIITNKSLDSSLSFLTPIKIDSYSEITTIVENLIAVKKECGGNEQSEIIKLRRELEEANKRIDELKTTTNKDKLLEREALKYFAKGLELSLSNKPTHAVDKYKTALELKPDLHEALYNWGTDLGNLAQTREGKEAEELYNQAFDKFQKAIDIKSDLHEALNNWGTDLGNLAQTKEGREAEELYNQAFEKFQKAIDIKPDKHEAFNNCGNALGNLAQTKEGKEAEELYNQAFEKFEKAIDIKPDLHEAFNNWGNDLGNLAKTKEGKEAEELYNQAFEKFQKAIDIKPDKHEALYNWGTYLGNLAQTKEGKEAEELYNQAFEKFQKAIDIKPDKHEALYNWGTYLGNLAQTKEGKEAEELYNQAFEKFQKAIEYGASSYNLSCILALQGELGKALKYLEISLSKNEVDVAFVENDEDWINYLEDQEFLNLLNKFKR